MLLVCVADCCLHCSNASSSYVVANTRMLWQTCSTCMPEVRCAITRNSSAFSAAACCHMPLQLFSVAEVATVSRLPQLTR
jgi:hypothetical protein